MYTFLIATIVLTILLGAFAIFHMRDVANWRRVTGIFMLASIVALSFFGFSDMLGRPKPMRLSALAAATGDGTVLSNLTVEGVGIYLWVRPGGNSEPRYYILPWNKKTAEDLQHAQEQAQSGHGSVGLHFQRSWDNEDPKFYAIPQPMLPPKMGEPPPETVTAPEHGA